MATKLPPFEPVTQDELRRLWTARDDQETRRLILEVERYRRVIAEVDGLYKTVHQAWRDTNGGELVALFLLKEVLFTERFRLP